MVTPAPDIDAVFAAADARDLDRFLSFLSDDVRFRFANAATLHGRPAVADAVGTFFRSIRSQTHVIGRRHRTDDGYLLVMSVTYELLDGSVVTLPAVDVITVTDGLITGYQIYMDPTRSQLGHADGRPYRRTSRVFAAASASGRSSTMTAS